MTYISSNCAGVNWFQLSFRLLRKLPFAKEKIQKELDKNVVEMEDEIRKQIQNKPYITTLPEKGWTQEEILNEIDNLNDLGKLHLTVLFTIFILYLNVFFIYTDALKMLQN